MNVFCQIASNKPSFSSLKLNCVHLPHHLFYKCSQLLQALFSNVMQRKTAAQLLLTTSAIQSNVAFFFKSSPLSPAFLLCDARYREHMFSLCKVTNGKSHTGILLKVHRGHFPFFKCLSETESINPTSLRTCGLRWGLDQADASFRKYR